MPGVAPATDREAQAMSNEELNELTRAQLEAEARRLGYRVERDDPDEELRSMIHNGPLRKAA